MSLDVIYFQDGKTVTLFVPTEDTIFGYTTLEQSVVLDLKELEVKHPNTGTIDELLKRIMEGPPGQDIDRSLIGGDDPLAMRLSGGTSLLSMPSSMEVREFSVKDWLVDDAKEPDVEGGGGGAAEDQAKEQERLAKEQQDAKSFDCGQIDKARIEKELELAALADKMQDAIAQAKEKLKECSGAETEELMASSPSLVNIKELLVLRLKLLEACLPEARQGLQPVAIEDVRKEIRLEASGVKAAHVCADIDNLLSMGELGAKLQFMGNEATTGAQLATALKLFVDEMEPLRSLITSLKTQKDRFSSARASAAKQHASSKQKQQLIDSKEKVQAKARGKAKAKSHLASGGSAIFEDTPAEFQNEITMLDYKDPAYTSKLRTTVELGVPFIVVNSPYLHELQQSPLRLHFLVFRAGATANAQYAETGQVLQPLGAPPHCKREQRQYLAESLFGDGLQDLAGESSQTEFDELIVAAVKEGHETFSTEFLQMGALHGVMQGLVQVVLVDFKKTSEFVSMVAGAQSRPPASDGAVPSGKPGSHPSKVLTFLQGHGTSKEMFEEMGAFGMRFFTGSVPVGGILAVPPAFIKAQTIVPGKGHVLMLSTPYLSQSCLTRREEYLFVKDSVEIFQKPAENNPVWQLMGKVAKALDDMEAKGPAKAPAATPPSHSPQGQVDGKGEEKQKQVGQKRQDEQEKEKED